MYLPPEEKKPRSRAMRWTFRLIITGIIIFLAFLFVVNTISGTGDMQRSGLQQALSDVTGTKVSITKLTRFNVFPQFAIGFEGIDGVGASADTGFSVGEFTYAKSFGDWFFNNETAIQTLSIAQLRTNAGVIGPQIFEITKAEIIPAADKEQPYLKAEGLYGVQKFSARFDLTQTQFGMIPNYEIGTGKKFEVQLGDFNVTGKLLYKKKEVKLQDVTLRINDSAPVTGDVSVRAVDRNMTVTVNFTARESAGQLIWTPKKRLQEWKFSRLHFDQIVGNGPLWHDIRTSWEELVPPVSEKHDAATEPARALVTVDKLEGALTGDQLKGEFLFKAEGILGLWQGNLGDQGRIECGVLDKRAVAFKAEADLKNGTLTLNEKTGKIGFIPAKSFEKISVPAADIKNLKQNKTSACDDLLNVTAP